MGALDSYDLGKLLNLRCKYNYFSLSIKSSQNLASYLTPNQQQWQNSGFTTSVINWLLYRNLNNMIIGSIHTLLVRFQMKVKV
jgi:hypothetical protein